MGPVAVPILVAATAISAYSAYEQAQASGDIAEAQTEAAEQSAAANEVEAADARRRALRQARQQRAQIQASGIAAGTTGSSVDIAAAGQVSAQAAESASGISGQLLSASNQSALTQIVTQAEARQNKFAAIGGFASQVRDFTLQTKGGKEAVAKFL